MLLAFKHPFNASTFLKTGIAQSENLQYMNVLENPGKQWDIQDYPEISINLLACVTSLL